MTQAITRLYRVRKWDDHFEGAKSRTYKNKSSCSIPCKHGLGYKRLVRSKDGAALFGAWCALIQVLSRHKPQRKGYLTFDGTPKGVPYTSEDLELLTDIPAKYFDLMLKICSSKVVGWVDVMPSTDTIRDYEETIVPLNSDLDSDLDLDLDSDSSVADVVEFYNLNKGEMPLCRKATSTRSKQIKARIQEHGLEDLKATIIKCSELRFLNGDNDRKWKADLEWITKDSNYTKIIEGKYDNKDLPSSTETGQALNKSEAKRYFD